MRRAAGEAREVYQPLNTATVAQTGSTYTVMAGDTLQSVAQTVWGDASLWFLVAEANGLSSGSPLVAGQSLSIPGKIANVHNASGVFKPYNALDAMGNTTPTVRPSPQPPVRRQGCGVVGDIIAVIVAVVVAAVVAPYAIAAVTNLGAGASLGQAFTMGVVGTTASGAAIVSGGAMSAAIAAGTASIA